MSEVPIQLRSKLNVEAGQADIWLAADVDYGDEIIVKYLRMDSDPEQAGHERRRFAREVRCQSTLRHTGIMPILRYNTESDNPWYSMPKASKSFEDLVSSGPVDESDVVDVMADVFNAIEHAHNEGVLHRDLKPGNILFLDSPVNGAGGWVVADFGLCQDFNSSSTRITRANTAVGSIAYMAPEQFDDAHDVAATADIYALGKVLAHAFTGKRPFPSAHLDEVPSLFREVVRRCLAEEPSERYQSVAELRLALIATLGVDDDVINPAEECTRLLAEIQEGDTSDHKVDRLIRVLTHNDNNAVLHTDLVSVFKRPGLQALRDRNKEEFRLIVQDFDRHTDGSFPFSFTDNVADFFRAVYEVADEMPLRRLAAKRILVVAYEHNRFYPRRVLLNLASNATGLEASMFAELLEENGPATAFIADAAEGYSLAPIIRNALFPPPF